MDLHLSLDEGQGLSRQIYDQVRQAIAHGRLPGGTQLPSSRQLARSLGVARNTVAAAFDHLVAEGYLHARPGVGTFVSVDADQVRPPRQLADSALVPVPLWRRPTPQVPVLRSTRPQFDFRVGIPDESRFPYPTWRRQVDRCLRRSTDAAMYNDPAGPIELRESVARHLAVSRGLHIGPADLIVTNGVQQAGSLIAQVLLEPGDVVAMEEPGYPPVRRAFEAARATVVGVPVDDHGLVVDQLPARAKVVYVTPAHQFPLGVRMGLARRTALVHWASTHNAAVIEDDYDTDFRYGGLPVDPLHTLDGGGRVLYVGSFSKTMLPSLRVGYCVAPPRVREALRRARFVADWHGTTATHLALARFIDEGTLAAHIRRMRREYKQRRDRIALILDRAFSQQLERIPNAAGLHLAAWTRAASQETVASWIAAAAERGVALHSISDFADGEVRPGVVLGFGAIPVDRIDDGLRQLRVVLGT